MLKFLGTLGGRPTIGLGLSRANCGRLLEGKPIFIDLRVMLMDVEKLPNLNEATILIFGGENEEAMQLNLGEFTSGSPAIHDHYEEN